jgi:hypothetical protein
MRGQYLSLLTVTAPKRDDDIFSSSGGSLWNSYDKNTIFINSENDYTV